MARRDEAKDTASRRRNGLQEDERPIDGHGTLKPHSFTYDPSAQLDYRASGRTPASRPPAVLVLGDDTVVVEAFVRAAARFGSRLTVHTALSAETALLRLAALVHAGTPPDCLVTEHDMPGMSGRMLIGATRVLPGLEDIPVLVLTKLDDPSSRVELARLNVARLPTGVAGADLDVAVEWVREQAAQAR